MTMPFVDGLPTPRRHWAMLAVFCAVALSVVSLTSVSLALPVIAADLGVDDASSVAIVTIFQLALVSTLLPFAALGERIGYRRLFQSGLLLMGVASLACAWAPSLSWLVAARVLQALAGSAIMAMNPALLRLTVPASYLGRAIGLNATVVAVFTALGPSIASLVLSVATWPWLFLLNLPWIGLAFFIGRWALPQHVSPSLARFDGAAALLNIAMFLALFSGIRTLLSHPLPAAGLLVLAALLLRALLHHERDRPAPLLPLDLLRIPVVRLAVAASVCAFAAQLAAMVALPFLLYRELGRSMVETGLLIMAWPTAVALMAVISARLLERFSSATLCAAGGLTLCAGLLTLAGLPATAASPALVGVLMTCGVGFGCFQTPNNRSMIAATPRERSGSAGGMQATARLCGQTLGTTLAAMSFQCLPSAAARGALLMAAALAASAALISLRRRQFLSLSRRSPATIS